MCTNSENGAQGPRHPFNEEMHWYIWHVYQARSVEQCAVGLWAVDWTMDNLIDLTIFNLPWIRSHVHILHKGLTIVFVTRITGLMH